MFRHYTHETRLTHGHRKLRLVEDFREFPQVKNMSNMWHINTNRWLSWTHVRHIDTCQTIDMCDMFYMCFQMRKLSMSQCSGVWLWIFWSRRRFFLESPSKNRTLKYCPMLLVIYCIIINNRVPLHNDKNSKSLRVTFSFTWAINQNWKLENAKIVTAENEAGARLNG